MQDNQEQNNQSPQELLNKNQKIAVAVLGIFAVFIFVFWGVQFKKGLIVTPGSNSNNSADTLADGSAADNTDSNTDVALKNKDTDNDTLTDWDELNIYHTSPYLTDSDSDGISDSDEIAKGKDPNCPEGRNCNTPDISNNVSQNTSTISDLNLKNSTPVSSTTLSQDGLNEIMSGQIDATTLRKLLVEAGMDEKALNQISDEDLMANYQKTLSEQQSQ